MLRLVQNKILNELKELANVCDNTSIMSIRQLSKVVRNLDKQEKEEYIPIWKFIDGRQHYGLYCGKEILKLIDEIAKKR